MVDLSDWHVQFSWFSVRTFVEQILGVLCVREQSCDKSGRDFPCHHPAWETSRAEAF